MYHQAVLKIGVAAAIIWPQLAVGGRMPTPRNDSAASSRMFSGDQQRRVDDDRRDEVGQDLAEHDARVRRAERAGGLDELALAQRQHEPAHDARDVGPVGERDQMKMITPRPGWIVPPTQPRTAHAAPMPRPSSRIGIDSTTSIRRESSVSTQPR